MDNYLDFGTDSDSDDDMQCAELDSDEEEARDNDRLFKILMEPKTQSKRSRDVDDFEMEMEAELDKRAMEIESRGGLEHQKSLSRSSSTSSLNKKSPCPSPKPSRRSSIISTSGPSSSSSPSHQKKSVRFATTSTDSSCSSSTLQDPLIPKPPKQIKVHTNALEEGETTKTNEQTEEANKANPQSFYNDIYFDSDESDGEDEQSQKKKKKKKLILSNDDLFYDPESDARDQEWVDKRRRKYRQENSQTSQKPSTSISDPDSSSALPPSLPKVQPLPNSDAVLNCPACFTVLCLDCQQHALYSGQYRAMFVMNCNIVKDETIRVPIKETKKFKRTNRGEKRFENTKTMEDDPTNPAHLPENDSFNPVKCKVCRTQIAVYDTDEVYHFYNVLASVP